MAKMFLNSLWITLLVTILSGYVLACSISIPPLRRDFRKAESVFVGKVLSVQSTALTKAEEKRFSYLKDWESFSRIKFQVIKQWKGAAGNEREYVGIAFDLCGCPDWPMDQFVEGREYLVFAREKNTLTVCESESVTTEKTRRLDSFWFRTWARVYPF